MQDATNKGGLMKRPQASRCGKCDLAIIERKRQPCPRCGDMRRSVSASANENIGAGDRA